MRTLILLTILLCPAIAQAPPTKPVSLVVEVPVERVREIIRFAQKAELDDPQAGAHLRWLLQAEQITLVVKTQAKD